MGKLTQEIITKLNEYKPGIDINDCLWISGDLLAKYKSKNFKSGFEYIDQETVSEEEYKNLKEALLNLLNRNSEMHLIQGIISALRMTYDHTLIPLYSKYLKQSLENLKINNGIVYQCLLALGDIEEDVLEREGNSSSQSLMDIEKNVRQADNYLRKKDIITSW
jgi:hypothetical protein